MYDSALPILKKLLKGCTHVERLKGHGRKHVGYFATLPSGKKVYFVVRRNGSLFRATEKSQNNALEKNVATWMMEREVLRTLAKRGVEFVIVFVRDTADYYVSRMEDWFDGSKARDLPTRGFGDARHLSVHLMSKGTVYSTLTLTKI